MTSPLKFEHFTLSSTLILLMVNMSAALFHPFDNTKLINENATLLHPLINVSKAPSATDMNDPSFLANLPWHCLCSNDLLENENESECYCEGAQLVKIPQKMPQITRLCIANANFKVLREAGLKKYSSNLRDM